VVAWRKSADKSRVSNCRNGCDQLNCQFALKKQNNCYIQLRLLLAVLSQSRLGSVRVVTVTDWWGSLRSVRVVTVIDWWGSLWFQSRWYAFSACPTDDHWLSRLRNRREHSEQRVCTIRVVSLSTLKLWLQKRCTRRWPLVKDNVTSQWSLKQSPPAMINIPSYPPLS